MSLTSVVPIHKDSQHMHSPIPTLHTFMFQGKLRVITTSSFCVALAIMFFNTVLTKVNANTWEHCNIYTVLVLVIVASIGAPWLAFRLWDTLPHFCVFPKPPRCAQELTFSTNGFNLNRYLVVPTHQLLPLKVQRSVPHYNSKYYDQCGQIMVLIWRQN